MQAIDRLLHTGQKFKVINQSGFRHPNGGVYDMRQSLEAGTPVAEPCMCGNFSSSTIGHNSAMDRLQNNEAVPVYCNECMAPYEVVMQGALFTLVPFGTSHLLLENIS